MKIGSIGSGSAVVVCAHGRHLVVLGQVVDHDVEHEPVELGFGQRIGPFHLDRVLRGQDEERLAQRMRDARRRDLVFLHGLQQGGLGLGRSSVDLVGENHIGEDRPFDERHRPLVIGLLENLGARDVGRHQVGRELDPLELQVEELRERPDQQRFGQPRCAGDQAVSAGQHATIRCSITSSCPMITLASSAPIF